MKKIIEDVAGEIDILDRQRVKPGEKYLTYDDKLAKEMMNVTFNEGQGQPSFAT